MRILATALFILITLSSVYGQDLTADKAARQLSPDEIATELASLKKTSRDAKTPEAKRTIGLAAVNLAKSAIDSEEYVAAKELSSLAVQLIRAAKDPGSLQRAQAIQNKANELVKLAKEIDKARKSVEADPENPDANLTLGKYQCFVRQNWDEGLPLLAKCSDIELKTVAAMDLKNETESGAQAAVGDAWFETAEKKKKERASILPRAEHWYQTALSGLGDKDKVRVEGRLLICREAISGRSFTKITAEPANGVQSLGLVDCEKQATTAAVASGFNPKASWLFSLQFNARQWEPGDHAVFAWADGRSGKDPIVLLLNGSQMELRIDDCEADRRQSFQHQLTDNPAKKWFDVKLVHDAGAGEFEFYVDGKLIQREPLTITPSVDAKMPVCLGGFEGSGPRYHGQVKAVWLGNIK